LVQRNRQEIGRSQRRHLLCGIQRRPQPTSITELRSVYRRLSTVVNRLFASVDKGKAAIAKAIASDFTNSDLVWHANKAGVARSGELGYTSGTYEMRFKNAAGKMVLDKGKYLTVWKKQGNGSWNVLFDMFNTDLPPGAGMPNSWQTMIYDCNWQC